MKVGIATFHWSNNYGAVMQAHALQVYLEERGHLVEILDFRPGGHAPRWKKWIGKNRRECIKKWSVLHKQRLFDSFRKQHLKLSAVSAADKIELKRFEGEYDTLIAGSDQVWNPRWLEQFDGMFDFYFLSFGRKGVKRISYAASIGHSHEHSLEEHWQKKLAERLPGINVISVRERSSIPLVEALCGRKDAKLVVDPTILLPREYYERMVGSAHGSTGHYVFSYLLHGLEDDAQEVLEAFIDQDVKIVRCDAVKTGLHKGYVLPMPVQWLAYIRDAAYIVTNSFHAVVFSLIFHTPFTAILIGGAVGAMNSRITDLLEAVGLTDRVIEPGQGIRESVNDKTIDWDEVDFRLNKFKQSSEEYIRINIEGTGGLGNG